MSKRLWFGCAVVMLATVMSNAALVENFESYNVGSFVSQTGGAWSGNSDWEIMMDGDNKILKLGTYNEGPLMYLGETFSSEGQGYVLTAKMQMTTLTGWDSVYSGYLTDASETPMAYSSAHRFFTSGSNTVRVETTGGGAWVGGDWGRIMNDWTYIMETRVGDHITVWLSSSPIDIYNPGTPVIDTTAPGIDYPGNYFGLYGVGTVYFDDIMVSQIPEPATMCVLAAGGIFIAVRKRNK